MHERCKTNIWYSGSQNRCTVVVFCMEASHLNKVWHFVQTSNFPVLRFPQKINRICAMWTFPWILWTLLGCWVVHTILAMHVFVFTSLLLSGCVFAGQNFCPLIVNLVARSPAPQHAWVPPVSSGWQTSILLGELHGHWCLGKWGKKIF